MVQRRGKQFRIAWKLIVADAILRAFWLSCLPHTKGLMPKVLPVTGRYDEPAGPTQQHKQSQYHDVGLSVNQVMDS